MKLHNINQQSEEWFEVRKGKMTASHATAIGNCGKGLDTYINDLMAEYYSSGEQEYFSNKETDRGNEYEPVARAIYEFENNVKVDEVGFIEMNEFVGCSPDGLIADDGGLEIKSVADKGYLKYLLFGEKSINSSYLWQIQMNLLITGRKWWDLVIYNPNFKKSMCMFRILPDNEKFEKLKAGFIKGQEIIKNIKNKLNE